ncbi:hypothetical protein Btru_011122 [Bulinus truncatus]|nr:hypothetical protein Btru_011122 [Bulinus truncatus]
MGEFQKNVNYCPTSSSPCNGGGYISLGEADYYIQTGIPPNSPSLCLDDFIQATPVSFRFWQHKKPYSMNSSIFGQSSRKTGNKTHAKDNGRAMDDFNGRTTGNFRSARRNLKAMAYDGHMTHNDAVASSHGSSESLTESGYQYLPTYFASVHRDPSGYYSNIFSSGCRDERQSSCSAYASNAQGNPGYTLSCVRLPKSFDEGESAPSESSFLSESFSGKSDANRIVSNSRKTSESSSSSSLLSSTPPPLSSLSVLLSSSSTPSSSCYGGDTSDSSAHDSGILDPDVVVKSEASDSESVNKDCIHPILDHGLVIGPPVLYTGQVNQFHDHSLDFLKLKNKSSRSVYCVQCVNSSPGCQKFQELTCSAGESARNEFSNAPVVDNSAISKCHDRPDGDMSQSVDVCDCQQGCKVHCSEHSHVTVAQDMKEKGSHLCFGCQKPVFDRYVLHVKDHGYWHAECLKCSNCQDNLSSQKTCYVKNEQVFCRNDYNITQVISTPVIGPPVTGTPVIGKHVIGTHVIITQVIGTKVIGTKVIGTPVIGTPVIGTPVISTQVIGTEVICTEVIGTEVIGTKVIGTKVIGTKVIGTKVIGTQVIGTPVIGTPVIGT